MQNIITLENLNDTLNLVKEYVDEHTSSEGGTGSSDFMPIYGKLVRNFDDNIQHFYIGVPTGTDLTDLDLKFYRYSKVKLGTGGISGAIGKQKCLHEIWAIPQKNKIPLVNPEFIDKTNCNFTENNYDYYEVTGSIGNTTYDTFIDYCNAFTKTGYLTKEKDDIPLGQILKNKRNYLCLMKDNKIVSNLVSFHTQFDDTRFDEYRLKI